MNHKKDYYLNTEKWMNKVKGGVLKNKSCKNDLENMKRRKLLKPTIVVLVFIFSFVVSMGTLDSVSNTDTVNGSLEVVSVESVDGEAQESGEITQVSILSETPTTKAQSSTATEKRQLQQQ